MRVSVLTPTFNRRDLLREAITSFFQQDYEDKEMIVIDDGGTDGTQKMIEDFPDIDPRVKYFRKDNGGISSAYNFGLERATGELVCVLQDDDLFYNDYSLSSRVDVFEKAAAIGVFLEVLWTSAVDIHEDGSLMKTVPAVPVNVAQAWKSDLIYTESMMWRKEIHARIGGFYLKCNEDWDFKLRCLMECSCVAVPGLVTAKYRRWSGNASHDNIKSGRRGKAEREFRDRLKKRYWMICQ
jgi:glycosyltransferase involved in cell wall biosynthesis